VLVLVRTELLKLATTRAPWLLAGGAVVLTAILALQPVLQAGRGGKPSIGTAGAALDVIGALDRGALIALVLGVLAVTTEFRCHTITGSLLEVPARVRLMTAKALAAALVGLVLAAAGLTIVLVAGLLSGVLRADLVNADVVMRAIGLVVTYPVYAVLGVAVGAVLPRSQPLAVIFPVAWLLGLEALLLVTLFPTSVLRWSLSGAVAAMQNAGSVPGVLPVWLGAGILLGVTAAIFFSGSARLARTDIT
jgi:hypothetical protein